MATPLSVIETRAFMRQAAQEGMTDDERHAAVDFIAENPSAGDAIVGSGGYRKVRVSGRGKGKSGGYRIVTFHAGPAVYLVAVLSKGSRANFTRAEINALAKAAEHLRAEQRGRRTE